MGPRYQSDRVLGGNQDQSGGFGKERNLLLLSGIEPRFVGFPGRSLVTTPTELSQLLASVVRESVIMEQWWKNTGRGKQK